MSFVTHVKNLLTRESVVYDLSRNREFSDFYFIGFKETPFTIDFVTFVEADKLTEREIVMLRDKFFESVQAVSYDFGLKPMARNPNGLLVFIFQTDCSKSIVQFIQKQTKSNSFRKSAVIVSWAIDVQEKKIHTHNNPVSFMPPIFILEQTVFPGLDFLHNALERYSESKFFMSTATAPQFDGTVTVNQTKSRKPDLGEDFATQIQELQVKIEKIFGAMSAMSEQPKYSFPNAEKVQIFETVNTYIENQEMVNQPELHQALEKLKGEISVLQKQHTQVNTEAEAMPIIEAEFLEIKQNYPQRWKNLLQLKRWMKGLKSGTFNFSEYFVEETPWGRAALGFLEGFSEDLE